MCYVGMHPCMYACMNALNMNNRQDQRRLWVRFWAGTVFFISLHRRNQSGCAVPLRLPSNWNRGEVAKRKSELLPAQVDLYLQPDILQAVVLHQA